MTKALIDYALFALIGFTLLCFRPQICEAVDAVDEAANEIVGQISGTISLSGTEIQIPPDSFRQLSTNRLSGLSRSVEEAVSEALTSKGCLVSVHERGEEPLKILGSYQTSADALVVTVRLRKMGKTESTDLIVVQHEIDRDDIPSELLVDSFAAAVESLVRLLEQKTILMNDEQVILHTPLPLSEGEPTSRFAVDYEAELASSLDSSELFGGSHLGARHITRRIVPYYELGPEQVVLKLTLLDRMNKRLSESQTTVSGELVTESHRRLWDNRNLRVCSQIVSKGRNDVKPESSRAAELTGYLANSLRDRYGISVRSCTPDISWDRTLRITMKLLKQMTPDGFRLMNGNIELGVSDHNNNVLGALSRSEQVRAANDDRTINHLVKKMIDDDVLSKVASVILSYQKDDPANMR